MKASRARTVFNLTDICWQLYKKLRYSNTDNRVCRTANVCGLSDADRAQCDTWNLGCLVQYFPDLRDTQDWRYQGTLTSIMHNFDSMYLYQERCAPVNSHTSPSRCGHLGPLMDRYLGRVEGLKLED